MAKGALTAGETLDPLDYAERQKYPRSLVLRSAQLTLGAATGQCEILNISLGGIKIRLLEPLEGDGPLSLDIGAYGSFRGRVAWRDERYMGIEFDEDPDRVNALIRALLENPESNKENRQYARTSVLWSGMLHAGARGVPCRVHNISPHGAKVRLLEPIDRITRISVKIERFGEFPADVVWQKGDFIGIKFRDDPADIAQIFGDALPILRNG
jgi:hypothetical protein